MTPADTGERNKFNSPVHVATAKVAADGRIVTAEAASTSSAPAAMGPCASRK